MSTYVVTRHKGALDWLTQEGFLFDAHIAHLDISSLVAGDVVVGNLPIPMVAELTNKQVRYWHLAFDVPFELRGQELTAAQLRTLGISLKSYCVTEVLNQ
ncbi:CRISPR-associated protein Csx16 [Thiomicrospira sp. R3]|uniref:CRISPR-associated protein Csx16 n=1 Tax=Thiomicrospira sp. R3 TaxID=3035472 RepID=UPI00259B51F7|nr:CRISPR-associated protein Csx16 [Thiomicrospira sp. R3]WFE68499.1 CRISPR-associated protein Csx16 [Thiomicrospira sp. R3]